MIDALPAAKQLLGDKGYNANWFSTGARGADMASHRRPAAQSDRT
jgi:hypothetical protein